MANIAKISSYFCRKALEIKRTECKPKVLDYYEYDKNFFSDTLKIFPYLQEVKVNYFELYNLILLYLVYILNYTHI